MKSDLEILIEHVQSEYDYLKSSMDDCIEEWDLDSAKAFRESVVYTKKKLNALKCLQNPNHNKINQLSVLISKMERSLIERKFEMDNFDEQVSQKMEEHINEATQKKIEKYKHELETLKSTVPIHRNDDDKILELFERFERNEISELEFEIIKDKIYLILMVVNDHAELKFIGSERTKIEDYLVKSKQSILRNLGFNTETFKKQILSFKNFGKMKFLEELAIIYFEVFEIYGEVVNLKIGYHPTDNNVHDTPLS
jgi:hypothetical protein